MRLLFPLLAAAGAVRVYVVDRCGDQCEEAKPTEVTWHGESHIIQDIVDDTRRARAGFMKSEDGSKNYSTHLCRSDDCEFHDGPFPASAADLEGFDVVLVFQYMIHERCAELLDKFATIFSALPESTVKVLYWREALYYPPNHVKCQVDSYAKYFDLEMGVHFHSAILNPTFFPNPNADWYKAPNGPRGAKVLSLEGRTNMVLHLCSHCDQFPRDRYVEELEAAGIQVGKYGDCYDKRLPRNDNEALFATYKFTTAFENRVQTGYVTEKLLQHPLGRGLLPIYLGAPDVHDIPSIDGTDRPWYINAMDFSTPKHLADYLNYVANNATLYATYMQHFKTIVEPALNNNAYPHLFPDAPPQIARAMDASYSCSLLNVPHNVCFKGGDIHLRRASACSLCDYAYLARLKATTVLQAPREFSYEQITDCLFEDNDVPCSHALFDKNGGQQQQHQDEEEQVSEELSSSSVAQEQSVAPVDTNDQQNTAASAIEDVQSISAATTPSF